jgi:hypothetical protein
LVEVIVGTPVKERGNSRQIYYSVSSWTNQNKQSNKIMKSNRI